MFWTRHPEPKAEAPEVQSAGEQKFDAAMAAADELLVETRSVKQQIEPFRHADDPFTAIRRSTSLDGFYT